uniref:Secreted protein n=1 Tax=Cacopsylla melanoneura TaxID=428564 RepID=A0A8D8Y160_9HEMI
MELFPEGLCLVVVLVTLTGWIADESCCSYFILIIRIHRDFHIPLHRQFNLPQMVSQIVQKVAHIFYVLFEFKVCTVHEVSTILGVFKVVEQVIELGDIGLVQHVVGERHC